MLLSAAFMAVVMTEIMKTISEIMKDIYSAGT
jgi:hypothetical protein